MVDVTQVQDGAIVHGIDLKAWVGWMANRVNTYLLC